MLNSIWNRRSFLGRTAIGAGAVIGGSTAIELLSTTRVWAAAEGSDGDILNFALTLEYLEATFYERGNATSLITDSREKDIFATIQKDEEAHVQALTDTLTKLGVAPVAKPTITFPAATFATRESYLKLAMVFENTGVGAYLGQAGSITNKDILQAAAGIFGVEARHAALIGVISGATPEGGIYKGATETPIAKADVLAAVMPFLGGMPNTGFAPSQQSLTRNSVSSRSRSRLARRWSRRPPPSRPRLPRRPFTKWRRSTSRPHPTSTIRLPRGLRSRRPYSF